MDVEYPEMDVEYPSSPDQVKTSKTSAVMSLDVSSRVERLSHVRQAQLSALLDEWEAEGAVREMNERLNGGRGEVEAGELRGDCAETAR